MTRTTTVLPPPGYYAVPDPDKPDTITNWHVTDTSWQAWPPRSHYGPVMYRRELPKALDARVAAIRDLTTRRAAWSERVRAALLADLPRAAVRFAKGSGRCWNCGRTLTDQRSISLGVGPDCRRHLGLNDAALLNTENPALATAQLLTIRQLHQGATQ